MCSSYSLNNYMIYTYISGEGVNELFSHLAREALQQHRQQEQAHGQGGEGGNIRVFYILFLFCSVFCCCCFLWAFIVFFV